MAGSASVLIPKSHQLFVLVRSLVVSQLKKRRLKPGQISLVQSALNELLYFPPFFNRHFSKRRASGGRGVLL